MAAQRDPVPLGALAFVHAVAATEADGLRRWLAVHQLDAVLAAWLRGQGLAALAYHRLRQAGVLDRAPQTALRGAYYVAVAEAELRRRELARVLQVLAEVGISPVLLKGTAFAHTIYADPACRAMNDLDLWLTADEMPAGQAALAALGYVPQTSAARPPAWQLRFGGEIQMAGTADGSGLVELHWGVLAGEWLTRAAAVDEAGIRGRLRPITLYGCRALTLAPEDALIQAAVHYVLGHHFAEPWLRTLMDIALLTRRQGVDWDAIVQRARAWRVATIVWLVLRLACQLVGLDEALPVLLPLAPARVQGRLLSRLAPPRLLLEMRDITGSLRQRVLQPLLVDRPRDALRLAWRALWPEVAWSYSHTQGESNEPR